MRAFGRAALSFAWLEFKALRYYPINGVLQVIRSFVGVGIWFFVSLFLQDYASVSLDEYGGDFVAYVVVGVLFFQHTGVMLTLPFQSLSTAFWDKRLEVYHSRRFGLWAFVAGRFLWQFAYNTVLMLVALAVALLAADVRLTPEVPVGPAIGFYLVFVLTCFGLGLIGASNFFQLEVKRGREPVTWALDVLARIFSGIYYPLTVLPASIRWLTWSLPHTYALRGIRQVMIAGAGFGQADTLRMFLVLLGFSVVSLSVGVVLLTKAMRKAEQGNGVGIVV
jgi:ABC-2 type transport system permease protein